MQYIWQFAVFLALAFGLALAVWPMLRWRRYGQWLVAIVPIALPLTPLLIGAERVALRALTCFAAIELFFKTIDYIIRHRNALRGDSSFKSYATFLIPFPTLLVRFGQARRERRIESASLVPTSIALVVFGLGFVVVHWLNRVDLVQWFFLVDHTLKFVVFIVTIAALGRVLCGVERLLGYKSRPLIDNVFSSKTVGEFWYRYNTRVHDWLDHHVFRRAGGVRAPVPAVFATFLVSALFHEFMFAIATSRFDGYQFTFFMLQAPAVIVWRLAQKALAENAWGEGVLRTLTWVWMWATSMLFFHGVDQVFPFFYASKPWLP